MQHVPFPDGTFMGEVTLNFNPKRFERTLYQALCKAANTHGLSKQATEDTSGNPKTDRMDYKKLLTFANILATKLEDHTQQGERVGILLPNINANIATFFALTRNGRVPSMLQYIVAPETAYSACQTSQVRTVVTARSFLTKASEQGNTRPQAIVDYFIQQNMQVLYLEDLAKGVNLWHKLVALTKAIKDVKDPHIVATPHDEAVVLFTSGSEGAPKGVVLSHANILANHGQVCTQVKLDPTKDVVFNALPMFHCFGLLTATLLPLFEGMGVSLHTNPKDADLIPNLMHKSKATITFGTNSFFAAYAAEVLKTDGDYDPQTIFGHLRFAWAGAEALKEETRLMWQDKFGVTLLQGYGVTETSPVISLNMQDAHTPLSVGRIVPGTQYALVPIEGYDAGYELYVKGPQVMMGYLKADKPGKLVPPPEGWHNTGDIAYVDEKGYLFIVGRLSRFIKVKGEKVPLSVAENIAKNLWPDAEHGAAKYQYKNGDEAIILLTTASGVDLKAIEAEMKARKVPLRHMPKEVVQVNELPLLGSGKVDLRGLDKLAAEKLDDK